MRSVFLLPTLICALALAGCATERLARSAPAGVNLTGEWNFNPNLSDNPDIPTDSDKTPRRTPGSHRGRGGGRGGGGGLGMPPLGSGGPNFLPVSLRTQEQDSDARPPQTPPDPAASGDQPRGHHPSLRAPSHLSITQKDGNLTVRTNMPDGTQTVDEYTAGSSTTVPVGRDGSAQRNVGWRGAVFVVTTDAKQGGWREDDFALDEDGRLIMTTDTKGGRGGSREIKRVYDRERATR